VRAVLFDHELKFCGLHYRQIIRLSTLENLGNVDPALTSGILNNGACTLLIKLSALKYGSALSAVGRREAIRGMFRRNQVSRLRGAVSLMDASGHPLT
jgi:hypothetical protein